MNSDLELSTSGSLDSDRGLANRLHRHLQELPSRELRKRAELDKAGDLLAWWFQLDSEAALLGKSLKAAFGGGGGNPLAKAFEDGEISKIQYEILGFATSYYQQMFRIIQAGWNFIDRELSSIFDEYPPNELEMFKDILTEYYDGQFLWAEEGGKVAWNREEKIARYRAKLLLRCQGMLVHNSEEIEEPVEKTWTQYRTELGEYEQPKKGTFGWRIIVLHICLDYAKEDKHLKHLFDSYFVSARHINELTERWLRESRKNRTLPPSYRFKNSVLQEWRKGGYTNVTKLCPSKSQLPLTPISSG